MTDDAKLLVTLEGGVKRITFNRPERRNPVDRETARALRAAAGESAADGTRVVILTGAGDSFCAGADLAAALDFEAVNHDACFHSPVFAEGPTAFPEKRGAVFGPRG